MLNLSFAVGVDEPAIRKAVQYAVDRDVVVVAAAGNEARSQPGLTWYPAAYDGVLAVAGVDAAGQASAESNRGAWVDVAAPGEGLTTPSAGGAGFVAAGPARPDTVVHVTVETEEVEAPLTGGGDAHACVFASTLIGAGALILEPAPPTSR